MSCPACASYIETERRALMAGEAVESSDDPHTLAPCTCPGESTADVLHLAPHQLTRRPQRGTPRQLAWDTFCAELSMPTIGDDKAGAGGWAGGLYRGGIRRKTHQLGTELLTFDIDEDGDVDRVAAVLGRYQAVIHETYSSTLEAPRCRAVVRLAEAIDGDTYDQLHRVVRAHLHGAGVQVDEGAKDPTRLSYYPVRRPGMEYRWALCSGEPLDAAEVLGAQPPPALRPELPPPQHESAYMEGALRAAADAVSGAGPGSRHGLLCKEAWSLARLGLSEADIAGALLPAAIQSMGERRRREAERTIKDAVIARQRGGTS